MSIYFRFELFHTNLCFSAPLPALTEQQAAVTIPGTNLTIPLSAFTGNQPMIIPGANISLGGVQIPVSQGISIPSSASVQLPVASVASVAGAVQLAAGGDKAGDGAKDSKPSSPTGAGRWTASGPSVAEAWPLAVGRTFQYLVVVYSFVPLLVRSSSTVRFIAQLLLYFL